MWAKNSQSSNQVPRRSWRLRGEGNKKEIKEVEGSKEGGEKANSSEGKRDPSKKKKRGERERKKERHEDVTWSEGQG